MDMVSTSFGNVVVYDYNSLLDVIEKGCGYDFARYIGDVFKDMDEQIAYARQEVDTDLRSYEASLESYHSTMNDIVNQMDELIKQMLESSRMRKDKIIKKLEDMRSQLNDEL